MEILPLQTETEPPAPAVSSPPAGPPTAAGRTAGRITALRASLAPFRTVLLVYAGTRALLLLVAILNGALRHHALLNELSWWDGQWYQALAHHGYPRHALHARSTLGFMPLYPMVIWLFAHPIAWLRGGAFLHSIQIAGVLVSTVGGAVAAVLVQNLGASWWGERSGRRAAIAFCLFPGSVVLSMVYAEGILIPLAAGAILALQRRRWLLAGVLAALATASEPEALALIPVCGLAALLELRRAGWTARRCLLAPALSVLGAGGFAAFLWAWTGTPFATMIAQRYGWQEKTDPFAVVHLARSLGDEISFAHFNHPTINLNLLVGLVGAVFLLWALWLLWRSRRSVSPEALAWTLGISFLCLTSEFTPPNPRLLITAFPAVMVVGHRLRGRAAWAVAAGTTVALAGLSALTFVGTTLRP